MSSETHQENFARSKSGIAAQRSAKSTHPIYLNESMTPKKTALILVTVIGCIAILWPKVFYPMVFGGGIGAAQKTNFKDHGPLKDGCCDVVLDRDKFLNTSAAIEFGPHLYRKHINLYTGEISLRQERPAHLHPESIYQAMRERGRAIPETPTVPIVDTKARRPKPKPLMVPGRPGPIPGMRPPMGAGALHQPQSKGGSIGFIMPLYTIGIILFFGYTIMKIVFKKPIPNAPYGPAPVDSNFRKEVFGQESGRFVENLSNRDNGTKAHASSTKNISSYNRASSTASSSNKRNDQELYNASLSASTIASNLSSSIKQHQQQYLHNKPGTTQQKPAMEFKDKQDFCVKEKEQLMEIEKLRKKLEDTEREMAKLIAEMNSDQYEAKQSNQNSTTDTIENISNGHADDNEHNNKDNELKKGGKDTTPQQEQRKHRDYSAEREMKVLGMEVTASCEGGQKWTGRPPTPVLLPHSEHSTVEPLIEPTQIILEGKLAQQSNILVSDSVTKREEVYDKELNGTPEEPAVVLSSKMTLSLINLDTNKHNVNETKNDVESPLADDIEIINHDEN